MSGRRSAGVVFLVVAVLLFINGVVAITNGPDIAAPSGLGVSRAVGALLPGLVALIIGLWLVKKPKAG